MLYNYQLLFCPKNYPHHCHSSHSLPSSYLCVFYSLKKGAINITLGSEQTNCPDLKARLTLMLEYTSPVWGGLPEYLANEIQRVQNRSLDIIGVPRDMLPALEERRDEAAKAELQRILADKKHPNHAFIKHSRSYNFTLRSSAKLSVPVSKTTRHMNSFLPRASHILTAK